MKTISVNVSEPVYQDFLAHAKRNDRTAAELIREAMEQYQQNCIRQRTSLASLKPLDFGKVLWPLTAEDDLLEEMLGADGPTAEVAH